MTVRSTFRIVLRVGISAGLVAWLLSRIEIGEVITELGSVGAGTVLLVLALQGANTLLKAYKWKTLLGADGISVTLGSAFAAYMVGTFFNLFLPTSIGGDAVRALDAGRRSGRGVASITSVLVDRVLGFVALGVLGTAGLLSGAGQALDRVVLVAAAAGYGALLGGTILVFSPPALGWVAAFAAGRAGRLGKGVGEVAASLAAYRRSGRLIALVGVSIVAQAILIAAIVLLARGVGIGAPVAAFLVVVPLVGVLEALPVSIYGIGIRDVSYVYLLGFFGTDEARAVALSVLYVLVTVLYALLGGLAFVVRKPAGGGIPER